MLNLTKKKGVCLLFVNYKQTQQTAALRRGSSPFLPPTRINILAVAQKGEGGKKGKQFTHNYHSGMSRLPADVCLYYNGGQGAGPPLTKTRCVSHNHNTAREHAVRRTGTCTCPRPPFSLSLSCWRELAWSFGRGRGGAGGRKQENPLDKHAIRPYSVSAVRQTCSESRCSEEREVPA